MFDPKMSAINYQLVRQIVKSRILFDLSQNNIYHLLTNARFQMPATVGKIVSTVSYVGHMKNFTQNIKKILNVFSRSNFFLQVARMVDPDRQV